MSKIRIVNLGDVITQNQIETLLAFAAHINPTNPEAGQAVVRDILLGVHMQSDLAEFKQGNMSENDFTQGTISKIENVTNIKLTKEQFDTAWNKMNPTHQEFSPFLNMLRDWHQGDQKIILISYTNPKDMRYLKSQLDEAKIEYTLDENSQLNRIAGMPLHLSYTAKKTKAELIELALQQVLAPPSATLFGSAPQQRSDIKYIRSVKGQEDPIIAQLAEESRQSAVDAAKTEGIETLFWDKNSGQAFHEINSDCTYVVSAAKL